MLLETPPVVSWRTNSRSFFVPQNKPLSGIWAGGQELVALPGALLGEQIARVDHGWPAHEQITEPDVGMR